MYFYLVIEKYLIFFKFFCFITKDHSFCVLSEVINGPLYSQPTTRRSKVSLVQLLYCHSNLLSLYVYVIVHLQTASFDKSLLQRLPQNLYFSPSTSIRVDWTQPEEYFADANYTSSPGLNPPHPPLSKQSYTPITPQNSQLLNNNNIPTHLAATGVPIQSK